MSEPTRKLTGLTIRLGGESHEGWLPAGASVPLPTPARDVVVDLEIEFDGSGYLLICSAQDGSFTWDSWFESLDDAQAGARDFYGVDPIQWGI